MHTNPHFYEFNSRLLCWQKVENKLFMRQVLLLCFPRVSIFTIAFGFSFFCGASAFVVFRKIFFRFNLIKASSASQVFNPVLANVHDVKAAKRMVILQD